MNIFSEWFQITPIPVDAINGRYDLKIVALSYVIAVFASYVALNLVGRLRSEKNNQIRMYWLAGGAFAMGAGIWAMHFVGMLAFILPMPMEYDVGWTVASLIVAILASALALFILQKKDYSPAHFALGGLIVGLAISTMHYMGMEGMKIHVNIHYVPGLFFLSILIGIAAAESAIWLALQSNYGSRKRQFNLKVISSLLMGLAICGMHYTGMSAAVFTPNLLHHVMADENLAIEPSYLAYFITGISILIFTIALTASGYYKKMILAVENEKEFLNAMLDNLEDGIIACNAEGQITVLNHTIQTYINSNKVNKNINNISDYFSLFTINHTPLSPNEFPLKRALNGERVRGVELIMHTKNDGMRHVVIDGQKIINSEGSNLGAVIVIHDITDLKQTEKLKDEFVSTVSHELRTPLTSIRGSLGLLVSGVMGEFPEKVKKLLEIANNNCERLLLLINDILDIEKIEAGKMDFDLEVIELNQLLKESIDINKMYAEKFSVKIEFIPTDEDYLVTVDSGRLMQVLANLLSNACKFSYENETVAVAVKRVDSSVRVSISNRGDGISPEFQSRIFQKFSQGDSSTTRGKGGTGLGLNISKTIIEKLKGSLHFESNPNDLTTFYFDLPLAPQPLLSCEINKRSTQETGKRVLICDDDSDQANYLKLLLESAGFIADVALTAADARKLLENQEYHALLLDLILPDQDGISFIRELRTNQNTMNLPIIVLSVIAQEGRELSNGDAVSIVDWLDKPIDFSQLLMAISKIQKKDSQNMPHILHVEDNKDTQEIVEALLEKHAKVSTANNLKEAKELLKKDKYNLIILDLLLPDGNGIEILPTISKYHAPVLVFSDTKLNKDYSKFVSQALLKSNSSNEILLNTIKKLL
ncbi:sensory box histidine kinase/response regulator [Legionella gratiana]|uniref:histidine kinase n=1 Tax=Legionella gratiana TaxID=45066 RepID=A0A378J344_9GAMM|nr:MHYT domain-containing protein [Legionella gratiana]KTD14578.1 sensory box histidine kinase/response regulator [Legionella gratiana]STX41806.1 sensory box histidine kinase/response regulator [Legionella gratiana]